MSVITVTVADENGNTAMVQVRARHAHTTGGEPSSKARSTQSNSIDRLLYLGICQVGADATVGTLKALVEAEMQVPAAQQVGLWMPGAALPSLLPSPHVHAFPTPTTNTPTPEHRRCSRTGSRCGPTTPRSPRAAWGTTTSSSSCAGCVCICGWLMRLVALHWIDRLVDLVGWLVG